MIGGIGDWVVRVKGEVAVRWFPAWGSHWKLEIRNWKLEIRSWKLEGRIEKSVIINASLSAVWDVLTIPALMKQWMGEPEMDVEVITDWKVAHPIIFRGFHHVSFENKGTVLHFEPNQFICYSHLSSISRLPDKKESYTIIAFRLVRVQDKTSLSLTIENFPTESIFRHLDLYWNATLEVIRDFSENKWKK
jgi:uncharacterized protein YndB with AHSA1/START domain